MKGWHWQLALSLCAGLCFWTGSQARAGVPVKPTAAVKQAVMTDEATHEAIEGPVEEGKPPHRERWRLFHRAERPHPVRTSVRTNMQDCLNNYGIGCWATHNTVGCTSLRAELTFIFGSCRAFFGEPCFQGPPPPPYPGWVPPNSCGPAGCP
jgi:hypothetical protein